jgi:pimeloyl-ACP methyl ester carboxylesterase
LERASVPDLKRLGPQVCLIAVDRPGMGLSTFSDQCTVRTWPSDMIELVKHLSSSLGFEKVGVLATSGGTAFSLACAQQLQTTVAGVAIISPRTPRAPGVPLSEIDRAVLQSQRTPLLAKWYLNRQLKLSRRGSSRAGAAQFRRFAAIDQQFASVHANQLRRVILEATRFGTDGILQDFSQLLWPWGVCLADIEVPISLWQGECDYSAPRQTIDFLQRNLPHCEAIVLQHQGHFTALTEAAWPALEWLVSRLRSC